MKKNSHKRALNLLHDVITRRLDSTMKNPRAGRMSLLGTTHEAMPTEFAEKFFRRQNPIKIVPRNPNENYQAPKPAYAADAYPGKYIAKTLNFLADFSNVDNLVYCIDKRMQNSIKIKYQIIVDAEHKPKYALISIYE